MQTFLAVAGGDLDLIYLAGGDLDLCFSEFTLGVFGLKRTGFLATEGGTFFSLSVRGCLAGVCACLVLRYFKASPSSISMSYALAGLSNVCEGAINRALGKVVHLYHLILTRDKTVTLALQRTFRS